MSGPREGGSYLLDPATGAMTRNVEADAPAEPLAAPEAPPAASSESGVADSEPPPSNRRKAAKE